MFEFLKNMFGYQAYKVDYQQITIKKNKNLIEYDNSQNSPIKDIVINND